MQTIAELDSSLRQTQKLASDGRRSNSKGPGELSNTLIDVVAISHEFTDHCHKDTLIEIDPAVPVFATEKAAELIASWNHFQNVVTVPALSRQQSDWRRTSVSPLPEWVGISRIVTEGNQLYYHSALCITFIGDSNAAKQNEEAEAILYSPHGIVADDLRHLPDAKPKISTLALLHGLHDVGISGLKQLNLGAHNGLQAQRICKARYWVGTHDEVKKPGGLLAPFLRRSMISIQEAIDKERGEAGHIPDSSMLAAAKDVNFSDLRSGESLLLV